MTGLATLVGVVAELGLDGQDHSVRATPPEVSGSPSEGHGSDADIIENEPAPSLRLVGLAERGAR